MTDGQLLYLAFTAFYLVECLRWVPERCWIFHARSNGKSWTHSRPWHLFRTRGGAVAMLNPLPPFVIHTTAAMWPCVPHEEGLCIWDGEHKFTQNPRWETLQVHAEESVLYFTDKLQVRCLNAQDARDWVLRINAWKTASSEERCRSFLQMAQQMFDHKTLTKAVQALQGKVRWHKLLSLGIFLGCFLVLPFSYWRFATSFPTFIVIGLLYLLMFIQAFLVWRQVRRDWTLRPGAWLRIFSVAFFPPSSIRVLDWLSHLKIPGTHPLTLLQKEEEPACFHREAAKLWRETRWPLGDFPYRPWDGLEVQALAAYFKKTGIKTESLEEPPSLAASTSYCPRCLTVYAESAQACSDCNGINLMKSTASR